MQNARALARASRTIEQFARKAIPIRPSALRLCNEKRFCRHHHDWLMPALPVLAGSAGGTGLDAEDAARAKLALDHFGQRQQLTLDRDGDPAAQDGCIAA